MSDEEGASASAQAYSNGKNGDDGASGEEEGEEAEKKVEQYNAPPLPEVDELLKEQKALRIGGNFHELLLAPCKVTGENIPVSFKTFEKMQLDPTVLAVLVQCKFTSPTPVQIHSIPILLGRRDLMACSSTGSGKSAAYILPIVTKLLELCKPPRMGLPVLPQALILAPTRELVRQIGKQFKLFSGNTLLKTRVVYGGTNCASELFLLRHGCTIMVATPGRLCQLIIEHKVNFREVEFFVLDEADRMLDMKFKPELKDIIDALPSNTNRTSAMFSATLPAKVQRLGDYFLNNHIFVAVGILGGASIDVQQVFYCVEKADKRVQLLQVLEEECSNHKKILIFCAMRDGVDLLRDALERNRVEAVAMHGQKLQSEREKTLKEFVDGTATILVATSVAARGLDIPNVSLVINYDLPSDIDEYVHRIGRTGRAGHIGKAISFFEYHNDAPMAKQLVSILRYANKKVPKWMETLAAKGDRDYDNDDLCDPSGALFRSNDCRTSNAIGSVYAGMPLPCEDEDDTWE